MGKRLILEQAGGQQQTAAEGVLENECWKKSSGGNSLMRLRLLE
jgi:hypothetical protein